MPNSDHEELAAASKQILDAIANIPCSIGTATAIAAIGISTLKAMGVSFTEAVGLLQRVWDAPPMPPMQDPQ